MSRFRRSGFALPIVLVALVGCGPNTGTGNDSGTDTPRADTGALPDIVTRPDGGMIGMDSGVPSDTGAGADVPAPRDVVTPPTDTGPPPPADSGGPPGNPAFEDEILVIVNRHRGTGYSCGGRAYPAVGPLVMNPLLQLAARRHSLDMATRNFFAHNTPEGTTPGQRVAATGYVGSPVGENIAAGNGTATATMTQWMNSAGHCTNIMNGSYRSIGVGYAYEARSTYRHYWTQNFGGR